MCVCVCVHRSRSDDNNNTRESTKRVELAIGGEGTHECTVWNVSITALKFSRFPNTKTSPAGPDEIRRSGGSADHTSTLFFFETSNGYRYYHEEGYERRKDTLSRIGLKKDDGFGNGFD